MLFRSYISVLDGTGRTPPNVTYWSQFADGIQYEGAYSGTAGYQKNDVVTYGGSVYIAKQDSTNNLPTNTSYWDKFVDGISPQGVYNNGAAYVPGQVVAYGPNLYRCVAETTGNIPTNTSYWTLYTASVRSMGNWATATTYYLNDIVTYGGNSFICVVQHASATFATDLDANKWQKFNGGIRWRGTWTAATAYLTGDVVKSTVGSAYVANQDFTSSSAFNTDFTAGKWDLFVVGGSDVIPSINPSGSDVGKALVVKPDGTYGWIGGTGNILWVGPNGTDIAASGKNQTTPFATLKYACSQATSGTTIRVTAGTYLEQLPITVPANVAIVGDNQRTTIISPASGNSDDGTTPNSQSTMFLLSNGSILNKMTFTGMTGWVPGSTAADITTSTPKGVVARLNPASVVSTKSPYVLECAAMLSGGIGALVDGSVHASGNKSMLFHEFTVISDNGVGFWMKDGGKCEIVSCFTYYCYFGYAATGGSQIRSLSGNNSYGTYGAVASGFDSAESPLTGTLVGRELVYTNLGGTVNVGDTVTSSAGGTATVLNLQVSANKVYVNNITGTFAATNTLTFTSGGTATVATDALRDQRGFVLMVTGLSALPKAGVSIQVTGDSQAYVVQTVSGTWTNTSSILALVLTTEKVAGSASGTTATFRYNFSKVRLTGHDFLSVGTGGVSTTNYPGAPTQAAAQGNEITETYPGRVFYVSTDQDGNLRVGKYFRVDQATGKATLNASAFDLSGLSSLRLGSIGAQVGELISEFSSDATMSSGSNSKVPTEYAVKTFVNGKLQTSTTLSTGGNTQAPTVTAVKTYVDKAAGVWTTKSSAYTAVSGDLILADTTSAAFTITLPASPSVGDFVQIVDAASKFATNKLTVGRNGSNIMALAENLDMDVANTSVTFVYQGSTQGWRIS